MNNHSKLLISESPLQVLPSLAVEIGLNEAIVLQQIHYLSLSSCAVKIDGEYWIKKTIDELVRDAFPFWCEKTIKNIFKSLKSQGLIHIKKHGRSFDRCNYYAVAYEMLRWLSGEKSTRSIGQDLPDQMGPDLPDQMGQDLPDVISLDNNKKNIRLSGDKEFADRVISVYHNALPNHPRVRLLTAKRVKAVINCCSLKTTFKDLDFWQVYFESIKSSEWYTGENPRGWKADFDWLTNKDNFVKMYEKACSK